MSDLIIDFPPQYGRIFPRTCIHGKGPANTVIKLYEAGVGNYEWGRATSDIHGNWMIKPSADLKPTLAKNINSGIFGLIVAPGEDSKYWSNMVEVEIRTTPPPVYNPQLTIIYPPEGRTIPPRFIVCGTGPANTLIKLYEAGVGDKIWGSIISDAYGNWVITPTEDLQPTAGKNKGMFSLLATPDQKLWSNTISVHISKTPPVDPNQPLTIYHPTDGIPTVRRPYIAGTGPANANISLFEVGVGTPGWGSTVTDAYGNWMMTPAADLQPTAGKNNGMFGLLMAPNPPSGVWSNPVFIKVG
ncbi:MULTISPECIES: Ig-like domain-containing protein [Pseudomonas]|jgi:hypothetical protein|uniref:hypothetical protein n=1 Tax=Pseudomonas TaxID=286 RepID=UPI0018E620F3|nr:MULTISPECIES: hypothetical protein [Pseudomonas]MBI6619247.1 hypothetical protein [Pseudomonas corrugata]MBI6694341.1 hypothetical protein [Pseudomonas corrugata]WRV70488.1 hypothetical protein VQ575_10755 [Pseudomonas frederiksbergensis]